MNLINYLLPGDLVKAKHENLDFHKGEKYKIANIYQNGINLIVTVYSKKGDEFLFNTGMFAFSSPSVQKLKERMLKWRIRSFWNMNSCAHYSMSHKFDILAGYYYDIECKAIFLGDDCKNQIANINKHKRTLDHSVTHNKCRYHTEENIKITNYEEFEKYFLSIGSVDNLIYHLTLENISFSDQEHIDFLTMLACSQVPKLEKSLPEAGRFYKLFDENTTVDEFKNKIADLIFDTTELNKFQNEMIFDILTVFKLLPRSYGSTSITKILLGRSKNKQTEIEEYYGKYNDKIKYDLLFELCDKIILFMRYTKIISEYTVDRKEDDKWLGTYEYIGSTKINIKNLEILISEFKNNDT